MKRIDRNTREAIEYKDMPYLVIGSSCLMKEFHIFLQGDSLKKLIKKIRKGEDLRITIGDRCHTFEIVDTYGKYSKEAKDPL